MARMTIAQLTDENIRLRAQCAVLETKVADLQASCERYANLAAAPAVQAQARAWSGKPDPRDFRTYWDYVRAAKDWCRANRAPVSYKSREQYDELCNEMEG